MKEESPADPMENSGEFAAMTEKGDVKESISVMTILIHLTARLTELIRIYTGCRLPMCMVRVLTEG